jgi:PHD/YefM family antitoxin component YafN of YafNO toxin-antitoxin module
MTIMTVTSRKFNQDVSKIKRATLKGPVFITDRGHPAHVLLAIRDYQKLIKIQNEENIVDLLALKKGADIKFNPPKLSKKIYRAEEFD